MVDNPHSGCSKKITEKMEREILAEIHASRYEQEKTTRELGWRFDISDNFVLRILYKHKMCSCKPSYKPSLKEEMKAAHLNL